MKIRQVRAELFHADGRTDGQKEISTDMTKLIVAFRNFSNAREKWKKKNLELHCCCWLQVCFLNLQKSVDTIQFGVFLSESEGMDTLEVAYSLWIISRCSLSKSESTANACLPFPSLRGNVKELPEIR